eukprot:4179462-Pleurochrysis_carterae.AAC.1
MRLPPRTARVRATRPSPHLRGVLHGVVVGALAGLELEWKRQRARSIRLRGRRRLGADDAVDLALQPEHRREDVLLARHHARQTQPVQRRRQRGARPAAALHSART